MAENKTPLKTRAAFRKYLNELDPAYLHKHERYGQRTRLYGDYLYHQDREKFEVDFRDWLDSEGVMADKSPRHTTKTKTKGESK